MDFTGHLLFPFLLLLLLLFSAFLRPTTAYYRPRNNDHLFLRPPTASPLPQPSIPKSLKAICNLTSYPSLCLSTVTSHLPVPSTTTSVLLLLLQSAKNETATAKATFSVLARNRKTSPEVAAALRNCEMRYGDSLDDYNGAVAAVKGRNWAKAQIDLSAVLDWYDECGEGGDAPGDPTVGDGPWVRFNGRLTKLVDDCLDLCALLKRQ